MVFIVSNNSTLILNTSLEGMNGEMILQTDNMRGFSGAYRCSDVTFLLSLVEMDMTPVAEKEVLIQSGKKHYSEMLSEEPAPTALHLELFSQSLQDAGPRLAQEVEYLAQQLHHYCTSEPIILISLVRAGVPLGVMLQRALQDIGHVSYHYGISIIRDRGIDEVALSEIEARHGMKGLFFVDGWTGKGAISQQLANSLAMRQGYSERPHLVVLADPSGTAWLSATKEDWLIPFGIMGAPVSGMISRSIWQTDGYHGCVYCQHLDDFDCSQSFVDQVDQLRRAFTLNKKRQVPKEFESMAMPFDDSAFFDVNKQQQRFAKTTEIIERVAARYQIEQINRIKPGIAEATRAILRRVPEVVLVRTKDDPDTALLRYLAKTKGISITEVGDFIGHYRALTIIKKVL